MDPVITLLRDLVAIESVNPSLVAGAPGESQVAQALAAHMRSFGLDVHVEEVAPGRPNVIGVLGGRQRGPSLMFCGHTDTVGVAGMSEPFDPVIRDGRLYGRGSQDMKGGVAAMVDAARVLAARGLDRGCVLVACVADEEYASIGADALVRRWRADGAIVTEPTDLRVAIGHKGFAWLTVETHGRAAHGSRPKDGIDAIALMGRVLTGLERLDRELQSRAAHPVMGTPSLHASLVSGGRELSVYPDRCELQFERRTVAGETDAVVEAEVKALLDRLAAEDPRFRASARLTFSRPAYELSADHELVRRLRRASPRSADVTGMSFWTDAAVLAGAGIPSVLFGPGGAGLHSVEEYVLVQDVIDCRDALVRVAEEWIGTGNENEG